MKILHINGSDKGGGAEDFVFSFVNDIGFNSTLLVSNKQTTLNKVIVFPKYFSDFFFNFCDKVLYKLNIRKKLRQCLSINESFHFTINKLRKIKEYQAADIVHLHNLHGGYFDIDALYQIAQEKFIVWTLHDMWAVTGGEAYTLDNENYKIGKGWTPYDNLYPLNSPFIDLRQYYLEKKKKIYEAIAEKIVFVPDAEWLKQILLSSYVYNKNLKISTIHCGIDTSLYKNNSKRNWHIPRILIVHSDNAFKGSEIYAKVFRSLNAQYELFVIGNPINFITNALNTKHFAFIEDKNALNEIMNQVDILIFPSKADVCPLTILIAMACGVCVIASDVGGISEIISEESGILFQNSNMKELSDKMISSLNNMQVTRKTGENASKRIIEKFSSKSMYEKYADLYKKMLKS